MYIYIFKCNFIYFTMITKYIQLLLIMLVDSNVCICLVFLLEETRHIVWYIVMCNDSMGKYKMSIACNPSKWPRTTCVNSELNKRVEEGLLYQPNNVSITECKCILVCWHVVQYEGFTIIIQQASWQNYTLIQPTVIYNEIQLSNILYI